MPDRPVCICDANVLYPHSCGILWMFLVAKSMSAATAALGFSGYLLGAFGIEAEGLLVPVALGAVLVLTAVVLLGIRRSNVTNITTVSITLAALVFFVVAGSPTALSSGTANFVGFFDAPGGGGGISALLYASALMFVAYTGHGLARWRRDTDAGS